jgi:hypothetical protein
MRKLPLRVAYQLTSKELLEPLSGPVVVPSDDELLDAAYQSLRSALDTSSRLPPHTAAPPPPA